MRIAREYKIWETVQDAKSLYREYLGEVLIQRLDDTRGLAIATDGSMLAVVPVELDKNDVPGLIRADLLKLAAKVTPRSFGDVALALVSEDDVVLPGDGSTHKRTNYAGARYPDISRVVPAYPHKPAGYAPPFDAALLGKIVRALGIEKIALTPNAKSTGPMIVSGIHADRTPGTRPVAPYGILMPLVEIEAKAGRSAA